MSDPIYRFLLIDDDEATNVFNAFVIEKTVENAEVNIVADGPKALEWLKSNSTTVPDVILLDINMPFMSGWEFLECLTQFPHDKIPPKIIIFHTRKTTTEQKDVISKLKSQIRFYDKPLKQELLFTFITER